MLLSLDGTLVVQAVNFIIFLVILNVIFLGPVGSAIAARRAYIDKVGADIAQFEYDLKSLRVHADEKRATARRQADATIAAARAQAQNEATVIVNDHQEQAGAIIAEAQATAAIELTQARTSGTAAIEALAREMLERAVGPESVTR